MLAIIVTLLIFSILVVVHEFGHFIVARRNGILVEEFAVGMGPLIFGKEKDGTLYSLRLLPIGGYCKMLGEAGEEEGAVPDERAFSSKTVFQRICVCLAGVVMNFFLAVFLAVIIASFSNIRETVITDVMDGGPAQSAGLITGDKIVKIDKKNINIYDDLYYAQIRSGEKAVSIEYERNGERYITSLTPQKQLNEDGSATYIYGVFLQVKTGIFASEVEGIEKAGILETISTGFNKALYSIKVVFDSLGDMIQRKIKADQLAGPIGVGGIVNDSIKMSDQYGVSVTILLLMELAVLLSANLAVLNLLPIPALDGGRILFLIIEGIRRKPMDPAKEGLIQLVSFAFVIVLALFIAYNDVLNLIK